MALLSGHLPQPADLDRRFHAFVVDRLLAWSLYAVTAAVAWWALIDGGDVVAGIAVITAVVLAVSLGFAVLLGSRGVTPGLAVAGLRTLDAESGRPIGVGRALLRQGVLGASTLPLFGLGTAALAYTVVEDRSGRRRGWHDHLAGSIVTDTRPPAEVEVAPEAPRPVVNLTAQRLEPVRPQSVDPAQSTLIAQESPIAGARAGAALVPEPPAPPAPVAPSAARSPDAPAGRPGAVPPPPPPPPPPPAARAPRWRITMDSGETCLIDGVALLGRNPAARPGEQVTRLLALRSESMGISKTHAQLHVAPDGSLVVTDRGSTNGTVLMRQGVSRDVLAGRPATLLPDDRVVIGDRELTVTREG